MATDPRWVYGNTHARFTLIEYADLECPYCRAYFPVLRQWIDAHPELNWQWHHLPLAMHDPAATRDALFAECAGELGGNSAFWESIAWLYQRDGASSTSLAARQQVPLQFQSAAIQACVATRRPFARIQSQADAAARDGIDATPTLRLIDHRTNRTLVLRGPVETDALLSAVDLITSPEDGR